MFGWRSAVKHVRENFLDHFVFSANRETGGYVQDKTNGRIYPTASSVIKRSEQNPGKNAKKSVIYFVCIKFKFWMLGMLKYLNLDVFG